MKWHDVGCSGNWLSQESGPGERACRKLTLKPADSTRAAAVMTDTCLLADSILEPLPSCVEMSSV